MSVPHCKGRIRVKENDRKWYLEKGKSSMLYTCCEACYNNYIKNTPNEQNYVETTAVNGANCDYLLYETNCNFVDCSVTKNGIRVSIIDSTGRRCKLSPNDNTTFLAKNGDTYSFLIENLTDNPNKETSKIMLDACKINNEEFNLPPSQRCSPFIIEANIIKNSMGYICNDDDDSEMPELTENNENNENNDNFSKKCIEDLNQKLSENKIIRIVENNLNVKTANISDDDLIFTVSKYEQLNTLQISELKQSNLGIFSNNIGMPILSLDVSDGSKYKAFFCIDTYSCKPDNVTQFSISVKFIIEDEMLNVDSDKEKYNEFSINI